MCVRLKQVSHMLVLHANRRIDLQNAQWVHVLLRVLLVFASLTRLCFTFCFGIVLYWAIPLVVSLGMKREGGEPWANSRMLKPRRREEEEKHLLLQSPTQRPTNRQNSAGRVVVALVFSSSVDRNLVSSRTTFHALFSLSLDVYVTWWPAKQKV